MHFFEKADRENHERQLRSAGMHRAHPNGTQYTILTRIKWTFLDTPFGMLSCETQYGFLGGSFLVFLVPTLRLL